MNTTPVPILHSVAAAYAFLISHWQRALIAAVPYTLLYVAQLFLLANLEASATESVAWMSLSLALSVLTLIASLALSASMLRMAVKGDYSGTFGLKVGPDEWRLFLVSVLVLALTILVFVMVFMFWAVFFSLIASGALERAGIDPADSGFDLAQATGYMTLADWGVVVVTGALGGFMLAWLTARLVLAYPATIANGKLLVLSVWPLSNGQAWRIALALILAAVPLVVLEIGLYELVSILLQTRLLEDAPLLSTETPEHPGVLRIQEYERWVGLFAAVNLPLFSGLYAYIYRNRTENQDQNA